MNYLIFDEVTEFRVPIRAGAAVYPQLLEAIVEYVELASGVALYRAAGSGLPPYRIVDADGREIYACDE